jgi:flagellar basal body-associated protein FliL
MSKLKLPIIIAVVLAAAGAGLFFSGIVGGDKGPAKKHVVEPITLAPDQGQFVINLSDTDKSVILAVNVAVELEPMDDDHWAAFAGEGGGHGGATEAPGPLKVATYPKFFDAVLTEASQMDSDFLMTEAGKAQLKKNLLDRFHEIAVADEAALKSSAEADDPSHLGPPYHVSDIQFTKYAVQAVG